jgi:hypothetical protein
MAALSVGVITNDSHTYTERMTMDLTDKIAAYANALDSDIDAERLQQVRNSELWRGWMGTIYGCGVATTAGYAFDTKAEAVENARVMREQCREIRRNTNDERNAL